MFKSAAIISVLIWFDHLQIFAVDFKVIANSSVIESSLTKDQIAAIYMGTVKTWPSGQAVGPCQLKNKNAVTKSFFKASGINIKNYKRHWRKMLFSGNGTPPNVLNSDKAMVDFVSANEGAVGFVSKSTVVAEVKVISVN